MGLGKERFARPLFLFKSRASVDKRNEYHIRFYRYKNDKVSYSQFSFRNKENSVPPKSGKYSFQLLTENRCEYCFKQQLQRA